MMQSMSQPSTAVELIRKIRREMGGEEITGRALARTIGISPSTLSSRLKGRTPFTVDELHKIADALGKPAAYFLPEPDGDTSTQS